MIVIMYIPTSIWESYSSSSFTVAIQWEFIMYLSHNGLEAFEMKDKETNL